MYFLCVWSICFYYVKCCISIQYYGEAGYEFAIIQLIFVTNIIPVLNIGVFFMLNWEITELFVIVRIAVVLKFFTNMVPKIYIYMYIMYVLRCLMLSQHSPKYRTIFIRMGNKNKNSEFVLTSSTRHAIKFRESYYFSYHVKCKFMVEFR